MPRINDIVNNNYLATATSTDAVNTIAANVGYNQVNVNQGTWIQNLGTITTVGDTVTVPYINQDNYGTRINPNFYQIPVMHKNGDTEFDSKNMTLKIFSSDKGWETYEVDDMKVENKEGKIAGDDEVNFRRRGLEDFLLEKREAPPLVDGHFFSVIAFINSTMNAGRSSGLRLVMRLPSRTTSAST